jgi:hypothetical protein
LNGAIAQLGERVLCKHEVVGSIPSGSTKVLAHEVLAHEVLARVERELGDGALSFRCDLQGSFSGRLALREW